MKDSHNSAEKQYFAHISHEPPSGQQNNMPPAPVVHSGSETGLGNEEETASREEIQTVQNLIERCLQLYMNREEVMNTLLIGAGVEPCVTNLVWQKLVVENVDFFKVYFIRLKLKAQITMFNKLLEQQCRLMENRGPPKVPLASMQNGIHHMPVDNISTGYHMLQHPPMPSAGHTQMDSIGGMPNCLMTNGIPPPVNFHPMAMNLGKDMPMDTGIVGTNSVIPVNNIKSESARDPSFVVSCGQYPYGSNGISNMTLEGLQVGPFEAIGNSEFPQNLRISDLGGTELTDFAVDQFLAEDYPCHAIQPEEESHGVTVQSPKSL